MATDTTNREAAIAALLALLDRTREPVLLTVQVLGGPTATFQLPALAEGAPLPADDLTECEQDVLDVLADAGERLSGSQVKERLQEKGRLHGASTVDKALGSLQRRKGKVTNQKDSYGRGYGLAEWS